MKQNLTNILKTQDYTRRKHFIKRKGKGFSSQQKNAKKVQNICFFVLPIQNFFVFLSLQTNKVTNLNTMSYGLCLFISNSGAY